MLIAFLALFIAIQGYLLNKFFANNRPGKLLLAAPSLWVICELLRSWVLTGFPWLFLGYSQIDSPLANYAPIVGVYGVSFTVCFIAGCLAALCTMQHRWEKLVMLLLIINTWTGGINLAHAKWTKIAAHKIPITLVQGNIPLEQKWDYAQLPKILNTYKKMTVKNWASKIIIWPEAAITECPQMLTKFLNTLANSAKLHNTTIITGIPIYENITNSYFNGAIAFGASKGIYLKKHLVPFGEYMPFKPLLLWLHNYIAIPMSDFSKGAKKQPQMIAANIPIAIFICYEIAYPNLVLDFMPETQLLVTISEDSWFGKSIAMDQHLEIARMRSLETGRYQAISTNTGITAVINAKGKIIAQAPMFKNTVLNAEVYPMYGSTPWVQYGHSLLWLLLPMFLLLAATIHYWQRKI